MFFKFKNLSRLIIIKFTDYTRVSPWRLILAHCKSSLLCILESAMKNSLPLNINILIVWLCNHCSEIRVQHRKGY